ncbi:MAG: STAS domain-containing protein [Planctomycetota bacterium]
MTNLAINTDPIEGVPDGLLIRLEGNIDAATCTGFGSRLDEMQEKGTRHLVFDLEGTHFVNSSGMSMMVKAADDVVNGGGSFVLIKIHPKLKIVFESLGLDGFFKTFSNFPRAQEYIMELLGGMQTSGRPAPRKERRVTAPPPAAPAPRRQKAMPPAPAAPSSRVPQRMPSGANIPTPATASGVNAPKAFIVQPPTMPHVNIIGNFVQAACGSAGIAAARMDPARPPYNQAALNACNFLIVDLTKDAGTGQPDPLVMQVAHAGRNFNPPKQVICLVQGSKTDLPEAFRNLPTVPYHASQQGMQYLKRYLEGGLKQLVARINR